MPVRPSLAALAAALLPTLAAADGPPAARAPSAALSRLRGLAGEWSGNAKGHGDPMPTHASIKVVSGGSAVMLVTDPGTQHEMVTLFHDDDGALLATHYCAAMNQPRMKAKPSPEGDRLVFEFQDGTNLEANPGHMQRLALVLPDARHQVQEWTFAAPDGKEQTMTMELTRDASPAAAR
jgi:hypothetical protein